jgi:DNA-binding transcriptional MerR regulator
MVVVQAPMRTALSISEAAVATGVTTHTLRYYERAGLMLDSVDRAPSSHRRYSPDDVSWVVFLTKLRKTGMPIRLMREYSDLVRVGDGTERERLALLVAHREMVRKQLGEVRQNLETIDLKIETYKEGIAN